MAEENTMVRVGKVSSVDSSKLMARVYYPSMSNMVSDWLPILQQPISGRTGSADGHTHSIGGVTILPKVNDKVLVIYEYGFNSQGYIVGVIP